MNYNGIPLKLKDLPNWCLWKWVEEGGKRRKIPYQICGQRARSNDPATWTTFENAYTAFIEAEGIYDGVCWMMPTRPGKYTFIDIDRCIENDVVAPWAIDVIKRFNSYTEISQSGRGIHIIIEAKKPFTRCCKKGSPFEIYDCLRPCYITGDLAGDPMLPNIKPRQEELDKFMHEIFGRNSILNQEGGADSQTNYKEVVRRIMKSSKAEKIDALFKGDLSDYDGDDSAADLALCNYLAYFSEKDPAIIDQLFRKSGLMRPKWDEMHGSKTYGQMTIEKAITDTKDVYGSTGSRNTEELTIDDITIVTKYDEITKKITRKFSPSHAASSIVDKIPLRLATWDLQEDKKETPIWTCDDDGIWAPHGTPLITSLCDIIAEDMSNKYLLDETMRRIRHYLRDNPAEFDTANPHLIGTVNGYACNLITGEARRIRPDDYISTDLVLPVEYDPGAKCPEVFKFYDSICSDDCSKMAMVDDDVATLDLEQWQYVLLELGLGGNGKGQRQKFRRKFFGKYSIASIPLMDLSKDNFAISEVYRKRAVNCGETRRDEGRGVKFDTTLIKRLTGDDEIAAARKYMNRHSFTPFAKLTIEANTAPRFDDDSRGFARRFRRINLPYFFTDMVDPNDPTQKPIDTQINAKITSSQELSGYLNVLLDRAKEIVKDRRYPSCDHLTKGYEEQVYSIDEFIDRFCEIDLSEPASWIAASDLYNNFERWAKLGTSSPSNKKAFGRAVGNMTGIRSKVHRPAGAGRPIKAYVGISFDWVRFSEAIDEREKRLVTNVLPNCNQEKGSSNHCNQCNQLSKRYIELREKFGGIPAQTPIEISMEKSGYIGNIGYTEACDADSNNGDGYKDGYNMVTEEAGACMPAPVDNSTMSDLASQVKQAVAQYEAEGRPIVSYTLAKHLGVLNRLTEVMDTLWSINYTQTNEIDPESHKPIWKPAKVGKADEPVDSPFDSVEGTMEWLCENMLYECSVCSEQFKMVSPHYVVDHPHRAYTMCPKCYELFPYFEKRVTELAKSEKTVDGITTKIDGEFGESYLDFYDDYVEWVVEKLVYEGKIEQPQPTCAACNKLINGKIEWYCNYNMNLKIMCHDCYEARMDAERRLSEMPPALGIGNIMDKLGVSDKVAVAARNKVIMSGKWGDPDQLIAIIRGSNRARHAQAAAN